MKCFVTGATGFVGGHLCERLARDGHEVHALARPGSNRSVLEQCCAHVVDGSIDSINVFARFAESADVVFHLAAITKALHRREFFRINTRGTARLLKGLRRGGFRGRLVLLSSLAAGGPAKDSRRPRLEVMPDEPVSSYGESKLLAEKHVRKHTPQGATWTILRPGAIYGPREHELLELFRVMHRTGVAVQFGPAVVLQLSHVEDVVDGMVTAAFRKEAAAKTYNVNDPAVWNFPDVVRLASEAMSRRIRTLRLPLVAGSVLAHALEAVGRVAGRPISPLTVDKMLEMRGRYWIANAQRIEADLEWRPRWTLPDGLRQTIDWYRRNGLL